MHSPNTEHTQAAPGRWMTARRRSPKELGPVINFWIEALETAFIRRGQYWVELATHRLIFHGKNELITLGSIFAFASNYANEDTRSQRNRKQDKMLAR
jgi:hypothetical protein